jgi:hypothetical protein
MHRNPCNLVFDCLVRADLAPFHERAGVIRVRLLSPVGERQRRPLIRLTVAGTGTTRVTCAVPCSSM